MPEPQVYTGYVNTTGEWQWQRAQRADEAIVFERCTCDECVPTRNPQPREETVIPDTIQRPVELPYWWADELRHRAARLPTEAECEFHVAIPGTAGYADTVRRAFEFIRSNGNGRYSDNTLMRMLRGAD